MSERKKINFELTPEELGGFTVEDLKCHACSGYGNCGYRQYRLQDGKPVLLCQLRKKKLQEKKLQEEAAQK